MDIKTTYVQYDLLGRFVPITEEEFEEIKKDCYVGATVGFYDESKKTLMNKVVIIRNVFIIFDQESSDEYAHELENKYFDYLESITGNNFRR